MNEDRVGLRDLVALLEPRLEAVDANTAVLCSGNGPATGLVTTQVAKALEHCRVFRTLPGHADALAGLMGVRPDEAAGTLPALDSLRQRGHFVDGASFLAAAIDGAAANAHGPAAICIRTCDRPDHLARLLGEILANRNRFGTARACVVVDDSADGSAAGKNRALIEAIRARGLEVDYVDRDAFGSTLEEAAEALDIDRETVFDLLLPNQGNGGETYGAALNRALLWLAGARILLLDDDAGLDPLELAGVADRRPTLSQRPYELRYLHADGARPAFLAEADIDPFAEHEVLIGHAACGAFLPRLRAGDGEFLRGLDAPTLAKLWNGGRIRLSASGVLGDSGSPSSLFFLLAPPAALEAVIGRRDRYERALEAHHIWRGHGAINVSPMCMLTATTLVGIDNTDLLPPVPPNGRAEDDLFSAAVEFMYPDTFVAELPWALEHAMTRMRHYDRRDFEVPHTPPFLHAVSAFIRGGAVQARGAGAEFRMEALSVLVRGLAAMDAASFEREWFASLAVARVSLLTALGESLRRHGDSPDYIRADIRRKIKVDSDFSRASLWPRPLGDARRQLDGYGRGLAIWPRLWRYFRDRQAGLRQAIPTR